MCPRLVFSQTFMGPFWPDELPNNGVGAGSRRSGREGVRALRGSLPDAPGAVCNLRVRSFCDDGFCSADISREPARHRGLSGGASPTALPLRRPGQGQAVQSALCKHQARLARICGSRLSTPTLSSTRSSASITTSDRTAPTPAPRQARCTNRHRSPSPMLEPFQGPNQTQFRKGRRRGVGNNVTLPYDRLNSVHLMVVDKKMNPPGAFPSYVCRRCEEDGSRFRFPSVPDVTANLAETGL